MPSITDYLENKIIDWLFRGENYSPPMTLYFALFSAEATETGGGTEFSGNGYARVGITASLANFAGTQADKSTTVSTGDSGKTSNNIDIEFPEPTGAWGTATHMAVFDAATDGNMLLYGELKKSKAIDAGASAPKFKIGKVVFTLDADSE